MAKPKMLDSNIAMSEGDKSWSGNVLNGATDADGDTITVARLDDGLCGGSKGGTTFKGEYGTLEIKPDGSYTYTLFDGVNLPANQTVVEDFKIKVRDGTGEYDQGYLRFVIAGDENNKPVAVDDGYSLSDSVQANVLDNDSDPDGDTLHVGGVIHLASGTNYHITGQGSVEIQGTYGTLTISDDGNFTYTVDYDDPDTIAAGGAGTERFAYKPHDGQNGEGNNTDYALLTFNFGDLVEA